MDKTKKHLTFDELVKLLPTPGWELVTGSESVPVKNQKLEDLVKTTHERHSRGEAPGLIQKIENEILLDLPQIQSLWIHMSLPF